MVSMTNGMTNVEIEDTPQGSNLYLLHSVEFFQPCPTHSDRARNISTPSGHPNFSLRPIMASVELDSYFRCSLVTISHSYSLYLYSAGKDMLGGTVVMTKP